MPGTSLKSICKEFDPETTAIHGNNLAIISNPQGKTVHIDQTMTGFPSFEIVCFNGSGIVESDEMTYSIAANQDLKLYNSRIVREISFSDNFKGYLFILSNKFRSTIINTDRFKIMEYLKSPITVNFDSEGSKRYYHYFELLKIILDKVGENTEENIRKFFEVTFWIFANYDSSYSEDNFSSRADAVEKKFMEILENDPIADLGNEYFANKLNLSEWNLIHIIKKQTGHTPSEHIATQKTNIARKLIAGMGENDSLSIIAEYLGFKSLSAFSRFFKAKTKTTPSEYQKSCRRKK